MFVQLWNSFPEELETAKQKIVYVNVMEDLSLKKRWYEIINIIIVESTEHVYMSQSKTYILLTLPTIKTKIQNGTWEVDWW